MNWQDDRDEIAFNWNKQFPRHSIDMCKGKSCGNCAFWQWDGIAITDHHFEIPLGECGGKERNLLDVCPNWKHYLCKEGLCKEQK